jgi:hypothetical protein
MQTLDINLQEPAAKGNGKALSEWKGKRAGTLH